MISRLLRPLRGLLLLVRSLGRVRTPSRLTVGDREFSLRMERWPARSHFLATHPRAYSYRLTAATMIEGKEHRVQFISKSIKSPSKSSDRLVRLSLYNKAKSSLSRSCHTD
jgi:hypothetical protein